MQQWTVPRAWDAVIPRRQWLQVGLGNGTVILGCPRLVATSVDTTDLDLYLEDAYFVHSEGLTPIAPAIGVLVPALSIAYIQTVVDSDDDLQLGES